MERTHSSLVSLLSFLFPALFSPFSLSLSPVLSSRSLRLLALSNRSLLFCCSPSLSFFCLSVRVDVPMCVSFCGCGEVLTGFFPWRNPGDWPTSWRGKDRTRPVDLLLLLRSYLGQGASDGRRKRGTLGSGSVDKVSIYPSDYGLERMAYELEHGPPELGDGEDVDDDDDVEPETEKTDFVKTRLNTVAARKYQRQKVKYYYAVAECDSVATANLYVVRKTERERAEESA